MANKQNTVAQETEVTGIVKTSVMKEKLFEIFNYCWRSDS